MCLIIKSESSVDIKLGFSCAPAASCDAVSYQTIFAMGWDEGLFSDVPSPSACIGRNA